MFFDDSNEPFFVATPPPTDEDVKQIARTVAAVAVESHHADGAASRPRHNASPIPSAHRWPQLDCRLGRRTSTSRIYHRQGTAGICSPYAIVSCLGETFVILSGKVNSLSRKAPGNSTRAFCIAGGAGS